MRQEMITPTILQRVSNRANLAIVLLVGGMFCLFRISLGPGGTSVAELAFPFIMLLGHLALSPLPWQWTGDDAPIAGLARGILQSLPFNLAWVAVLVSAMHVISPLHRPAPDERPPMASLDTGPRERRDPGPRPEGDRGPLMTPDGGPLGPPPFEDGQGPRRHDPRGPNMGLILVNVAFGLAFGWVFADKEATETRERNMAGLLRHSQSRALQNQLEPHVLYNALNGLSELVHEDPLAAEEMIARLADLYRMLTHHSEADMVPLMKERLLVEAYLSMEQMRLGERLRVEWAWPAWADAVILPPLFLQPLVENAIKHGISPCDAGGDLRITCVREEDEVVLAVANTGRPLAGGPRKGVGLANLEARLELWMEGAGTFTLTQQDEWTVAEVRWTVERT